MATQAAATIAQLESARQIVLGNAAHYQDVIRGVHPIIGANAPLEVRRWGADFLAEAFASPGLSTQAKEAIVVTERVLPLMHELLETPGQDEAVVKSITQAAASIYGPVFRHITNNPQNAETWAWMSAIKANILKRLDTDPLGIRVCCIKFVQRVVQIQTPGVVPDPRRPDQNEISSAAVSRDHPLIPSSRLEPEASGLLDRLLTVFYEDQSDALLVDATLNGFAILARMRPSIAPKIVTAVLNFNPFKNVRPGMTPKDKVRIQSMERTSTAFLVNYSRRNQTGPLAPRVATQINRLKQQRSELFDDGSKKRGPPIEPNDGLDNVKRARLGAQLNGRPAFLPLPPGPVSIAQLYTLTEDEALKSFDVKPIPIDLVVKITLPVLSRIDPGQLDQAITAIRSRYLDLSRQQQQPQAQPVVSTHTHLDVEDDDDYEPEFEPTEDSEQIINKMDALPADDKAETDLTLGPFQLAQPPPLTHDEAEQLGKGAISRVFSMMSKLEEPSKSTKHGLNRLAGSDYDKDAWVTVITRLATRACPADADEEDQKPDEKETLGLETEERSLSDGIRETLWKYVIEDFRNRIDIAITWLNEEWYNDRILQSQPDGMEAAPLSQQGNAIQKANYEKWVLKLLDAIIPYLDANDKILVRFLGEIPEISQTVLERVKNMARDPDRVTLAVKAIYYLVAFKPPSKEAAIDALEDLWTNYSDAKASVRPLLARVRPSALGDQAPNGVKREASSTPAVKEDPPAQPKAEPAPITAAG